MFVVEIAGRLFGPFLTIEAAEDYGFDAAMARSKGKVVSWGVRRVETAQVVEPRSL